METFDRGAGTWTIPIAFTAFHHVGEVSHGGRRTIIPMATKKPIKNLDGLFLHTLQDVLGGFETHLGETKEHIIRLNDIFESLGEKAKSEKCRAIEGIIEEAKELMSEIGTGSVMDVALAAATQAVEHYEISRYGTLISLARHLGKKEAIKPLEATLAEEKATDAKLTKLSESQVLHEAA